MATSSHHIFGTAPAAAPATPGSYGEPPAGTHRLPAATRLGEVHLQVADLGRSLAFYESVLGLHTVERDATGARLAAHGDDRTLVRLHEQRDARPMPARGRLGLYHFAILLPDRPALGRFVRHLADTGARAGASDHLVSEAFYLHDPDGLGIEVYADRDPSTWQRVGRELMMASDPIDSADLVTAAGSAPWTGMPAGTTIGHLHLHVGDLRQASAFYSDALGLDRTVWSFPGALFMAAGGYHHHLGTNIWAGNTAEPPDAGDARLLEWTMELPRAESIDDAADSLTGAGHAIERETSGAITVLDPWGTRLRLRVAR